ncbi:MAG: hypothetical protein EA379_01335 [Phycisphaerales bacterium]|nr:MAG: hypothetical protein EA379_01335 [Phycisphaerales bacterium]
MKKNKIMYAMAAIVVCGVAVFVGGCLGAEQADVIRSESSATVEQFETDLDALREQLAAAQASGDAEAIARAEKSVALMEKILEHARRGDAVLQASINPDGSINIEAIAQETAPYLPFPWNVAVVLGAGVVGRVLAERQIRAIRTAQQQAETDRDSIILGIDAARAADHDLAKLMKEYKGDILEHYTDSAHERVEKLSVT